VSQPLVRIGIVTPAEVLAALQEGDVAVIRDAADDIFRTQITESQIHDVWTSATEDLGPLSNVGSATVIHEIPLTFERGEGHLQVAYRDDRIAGLVLRPGPPTGRFGE
jgi:hypothetical protein